MRLLSNSYICIYRILDRRGRVAPGPEIEKLVNELQPDFLHKMYRTMSTLARMDTILYEAQRQGRKFSLSVF